MPVLRSQYSSLEMCARTTASTKRLAAAAAKSPTSSSSASISLRGSWGSSASSIRNLMVSGKQASNSTSTTTPAAISECSFQYGRR